VQCLRLSERFFSFRIAGLLLQSISTLPWYLKPEVGAYEFKNFTTGRQYSLKELVPSRLPPPAERNEGQQPNGVNVVSKRPLSTYRQHLHCWVNFWF